MKNTYSGKILTGAIIALLAVLAARAAFDRELNDSSGVAKYLVLISIDGGRPDYLSVVETPNINKLMEAGVTYDKAWVGHLRNDTPPGHVTISTGAFPRNHGIIGFHWRDPVTGRQFKPTTWFGVGRGQLNELIAASGVASLGSVYKWTFPGAKVAALSSDKFYAAAALGADCADFIGFCRYEPRRGFGTSVGQTLSPETVSGRQVPAAIMSNPALRQKVVNPWDGDTWTVDFALQLFTEEQPEILMLNLALCDDIGHTYGVDPSREQMAGIIANVDRQIGRLMEAYLQVGLYDQTVFVITSDHGMSANLYTIDETPMAQIAVDYGMVRSAARLEFYINDPAKAGEAAEKIARLGMPGIRAVYYKDKDSEDRYFYLPAPDSSGTLVADLDACYRYLTSTYASALSADLVLFPEENWNIQEATSYFAGDHGTATWENQHIPLVISGPGIRKGVASAAPARLADIAPTVLAAMGLPPAGMDGVVLADALQSPTAEQIEAQDAVNEQLRPLRNALAGTPVRPPQQITDFTFTRDYRPGTEDSNGRLLAGQELMRIIAWRGELFASTSTFTDPLGTRGDPRYTGCQILRKGSSDANWVADATFGRRYLRTDTLQPVRFTRDADGNPLPAPVEMLVAGIWDIGELMPGGARYITLAVKNDAAQTWTLSRGPFIPVTEKGFASVRCFWVHTDKVTGREYLFVGAACGGIYKVVYDPTQPGNLRWMQGNEVDVSYGRAHSMCVANGSLYVSFDYGGLTVQNQTGGIYLRHDGETPFWERVFYNYNPNYPTWNQTARGITAVPAEDGSGSQDILAGVEQPPDPVIVRIEPHRNHRAVTELNYSNYMQTNAFGGRTPAMIDATLAAAANYFDPFENPQTGRTEHFVTLVLYHPQDPAPNANGAWYLIRRSAEVYDWGYVPFIPFDVPANAINHLRGLRTVCRSPFPDEQDIYYFGGCFNGPSEQPPKSFMAWIYKGQLLKAEKDKP